MEFLNFPSQAPKAFSVENYPLLAPEAKAYQSEMDAMVMNLGYLTERFPPKMKSIGKKREKYAKIPISMRKQLVDLVEKESLTILKASKLMGLKYSTAKTIVQIFRKEGRINVFKKIPKKHLHSEKVLKPENLEGSATLSGDETNFHKSELTTESLSGKAVRKFSGSSTDDSATSALPSDLVSSDISRKDSGLAMETVKLPPLLPYLPNLPREKKQPHQPQQNLLPNILTTKEKDIPSEFWKQGSKLSEDTPTFDLSEYCPKIPLSYIYKLRMKLVRQFRQLLNIQNQYNSCLLLSKLKHHLSQTQKQNTQTQQTTSSSTVC
jgi:hypothetical protein